MSERRPDLKQGLLALSFVLGLFLLSSFGNPRHGHWILFAAFAVVAMVFVRQRLAGLALFSVVIHFFPDPVSRALFQHLVGDGTLGISSFEWFHGLSILLCLVSCFLCLRFLRPILSVRPGGHFLFLLFYLAVLGTVSALPVFAGQVILQYSLIQFVRFVWPLTHMMTVVPAEKEENLWITTGLLAPFWSFMVYYLPIPLSPVLLKAYQQEQPKDLWASQVSGVKMLYFSLLMYSLHNLFQILLYGHPAVVFPFVGADLLNLMDYSLRLPDVYRNFAEFSQISLSPVQKFAAIWGKDLLFVLELFPNFGIAIALGRFCGFRLPRMIYRPWQAGSFVQYMGSFLFYYQQLIVRLFFEPCLHYLKSQGGWLRQKSLRFSIFFAVLGGGVFFHLVRDGARLFSSKNAVGLTGSYFQVVPYFAALALLAAISSRRPLPLPAALRTLLFFMVHPLVIFAVMSVTRFQSDLKGYLRFILGLLGLS